LIALFADSSERERERKREQKKGFLDKWSTNKARALEEYALKRLSPTDKKKEAKAD
jgi:hypothetical protein